MDIHLHTYLYSFKYPIMARDGSFVINNTKIRCYPHVIVTPLYTNTQLKTDQNISLNYICYSTFLKVCCCHIQVFLEQN